MLRIVDELNKSAKDDSHRFRYDGATPFGASAVQEFTLGNGLRVLVLVDKSAPVLSYFTWYRVGSRHEKAGKTGLAHLFEHLMFNETENLKAGEFDRKLEENGAETNAATWFDWTYYYESLPKDRLGLGIKLESDRMARLVLRKPQVTSEKEVVANERRFRVDDDVEGTASELLYKTAFVRHGYGWPTIGWMQDIENFTEEDCAEFYRTYYAPNNATVVVVGDVREKDLLRKLRDAYGPIPAATIPEEDTQPEPPQTEERRVEITKPTASEKLLVGYRGPALGDADHPHLTVLNEILFGGRGSRLYEKLVTEREMATELRGWVSTFRDPGLYDVYIAARGAATADALLTELEQELDRVTRDLVSTEELERAKARMELGLLQSMDTMAGKAEQLGFYDTVLGDPAAAFRRLQAYRQTTAGHVRTAARRYLVQSARNIVIVRKQDDSREVAS
jgi:zinc protease